MAFLGFWVAVVKEQHTSPHLAAAGQWLQGETESASPETSCRGKGLGEGRGGVPQCCPPAPHPQALLSLSCVVASKTWKCHRAQGA